MGFADSGEVLAECGRVEVQWQRGKKKSDEADDEGNDEGESKAAEEDGEGENGDGYGREDARSEALVAAEEANEALGWVVDGAEDTDEWLDPLGMDDGGLAQRTDEAYARLWLRPGDGAQPTKVHQRWCHHTTPQTPPLGLHTLNHHTANATIPPTPPYRQRHHTANAPTPRLLRCPRQRASSGVGATTRIEKWASLGAAEPSPPPLSCWDGRA